MVGKLKSILFNIVKRNCHSRNLRKIELIPFDKNIINSESKTITQFEKGYDKFKLILDVRSACEYQIDHLPNAVNIPILNDDERVTVGKLYETSNPLPARLIGSSLIMNNLSKYLQPGGILFEALKVNITNDNDRILVYCWRGGQRSKSVALVLSEISLNSQPVCVLNGGYKSYRRHVLDNLTQLTNHITFIGICGLTGSGKTKILHHLKKNGEVVLDLECLADHKGSIFGSHLKDLIYDSDAKFTQISQKLFDTRLNHVLVDLLNDTSNSAKRYKNGKLIVWVECESRNIGSLHLPSAIWNLVQQSKRVIIETPLEERVKNITEEYKYWTCDSYLHVTQSMINWLSKNCSKSLVSYWTNLVADRKFDELVQSLLTEHYDPIYKRNRQRFIDCVDETAVVKVQIDSLDDQFIEKCVYPKLVNICKSLFN